MGGRAFSMHQMPERDAPSWGLESQPNSLSPPSVADKRPRPTAETLRVGLKYLGEPRLRAFPADGLLPFAIPLPPLGNYLPDLSGHSERRVRAS